VSLADRSPDSRRTSERLRLPTLDGQWLVQSKKRPLTVAGQWRIFTALPEHRASELLVLRQLDT
jgi:hypothetical protein